MVTVNDLYEGLIFSHKNSKSIYRIDKIINRQIDTYSYQFDKVYENDMSVEYAIANINNGTWIIKTPIKIIHEVW